MAKLRVTPEASFSVNDWTAVVVFIVIIGGIGRIEGPILGTLVYSSLRGLLADYGSTYMITLGAISILTMLYAPRGLWGAIEQQLGFNIFETRRTLESTASPD